MDTININRNMTMFESTVLDFRIDNGGVTKFYKSNDATLAGNLQAGFKGGVAMTANTSFQVLEARAFLNTPDAFVSKPDAALWDVTIANDINGTRDALTLSYAAGANQGQPCF
jgi:hypothetical protein